MVKPDAVAKSEEILRILDQYGERLRTVEIDFVPREVIEQHYIVHRNKSFYGYMTNYFIGMPVTIAIYEGDIKQFRDVIGVTDPRKAAKGTIRNIYSNDSLEEAMKEKRTTRTVIHCSDSVDEAIREIQAWSRFWN